MRPVILTVAVALGVTAGVAACQTAAESETAAAEMQALVAARQGEETDRICFASNINGWSPLGRTAILLEQGVNDWYKVDLTGTCDPQWAFNAIAIASRPLGSNCITRGDRITTDDETIPGVCYVDRIYEWDETAEPAPVSAPAASPSAG